MARLAALLLLGSLLALAAGCGDKIDPITVLPPPPDGGADSLITYTKDIKAILDNRCIRCHSHDKQGLDRNGAPVTVNLNTYEGAVTSADLANYRIQTGTMPPDVSGGIPLDERALFQAWLNQGLLQ